MEWKKEIVIISKAIIGVNWKTWIKTEDIESIKKKSAKEEKHFRCMNLIVQEKSRREKILNYYQILRISKISTQEEIERSYQKLIWRLDQDKFDAKGLEGKQKIDEKIRELNEVYEILGDEDMRKWFDSFINDKDEKINPPIKELFFVGALVLLIYLVSEENEKK